MLLGPLAAAAILAVGHRPTCSGPRPSPCSSQAALVAWLPAGRAPLPSIVMADDAAAGTTAVGPEPDPSLLGGLRLVVRERNTRLVVSILTLRMIVIGALDVLYVLIALEVFGIGDSGAGLLNAAMGLGVVLAARSRSGSAAGRGSHPALAVAAAATGIGLVVVGAGASAGRGRAVARGRRHRVRGLRRDRPDHPPARDPRRGARPRPRCAGGACVHRARGRIMAAPILVALVGVQGAFVVAGLLLPLGVALSWLGLRSMERTALSAPGARAAPRVGDLRAAPAGRGRASRT
jgi:hypothetical protein